LESFSKAKIVFHLAAQPGVRESWGKNFVIYVKNNLLLTQRLLEFYKNKQINKFIYISSSSVYGKSEVLPQAESSPTNPLSPYGVTKLAGEKLALLYWQNYSLPVVVLRYFTVYGPALRPDLAIHRFILSALQQKPVVIFDKGNQKRDFTFIKDTVKATLSAISAPAGEIINIGSGKPVSINELIVLISRVLSTDISITYKPHSIGDPPITWADIKKANKLLGFSPETSLLDGLLHTINWAKKFYQL